MLTDVQYAALVLGMSEPKEQVKCWIDGVAYYSVQAALDSVGGNYEVFFTKVQVNLKGIDSEEEARAALRLLDLEPTEERLRMLKTGVTNLYAP